MKRTKKIAVLAGGNSGEAEVSRSSAAQVANALNQIYKDVRLLELDTSLAPILLDWSPDVVFPVLHGPPGEDGTVQGFLEILGLPYVGNGVRASAAAMDKGIAKSLFRSVGLPVCEDLEYRASANIEQAATEIEKRLGKQVVIKPVNQGSALGVVPLMNGGDIAAALRETFSLEVDVIVEPFVMGREMTVGILDLEGEDSIATPVIEITTPEGAWYDYEHRYATGLSGHIIPATIPNETARRLQEISLAAHQILKCRDLSRADFIVTDDNEIVLLEVNTLPGMTPTSLYPDGLRALNISFIELVEKLVESALKRDLKIKQHLKNL
ncbi:MAG: D-alanine--D-alanine ligase [Pseudomonadales bacterium]|nr:D-alanine--D-alanine ligase [Pseudomonadales bacterium]